MIIYKKINVFSVLIISIINLVLLASIFINFPNEIIIEAIFFLFFNFFISIAYVTLVSIKGEIIFCHLCYFVFWLVYVVKAIIQYFSGLDTIYVRRTIRTAIDFTTYLDTLFYVSFAHVCLVFLLLALSRMRRTVQTKNSAVMLSKCSRNLVLIFSFIFISISSIIMKTYGVAVMGTEGVSLPFKLTGFFYYGRTIVVPMVLLFIIVSAFKLNDIKTLKKVILLFLFLCINEIIVRASKAPLFTMILQITLAYLVVCGEVDKILIKIKKRYVIGGLMIALAMWPVIETYRALTVQGDGAMQLAVEFSGYSDQNIILYSIQRLFQRLLGVLQFSGIIKSGIDFHTLDNISNFDSLARYYTNYYLGYNQEGHLSSPSLLGVSVILGGGLWFLIFSFFIVISFFIWRVSIFFQFLSIPIKCFLGVFLFNTIMAGTIDFFFIDLSFVILIAVLIFFIFRLSIINVFKGKK